MQGQLTAALEGKDWSSSLPSEADSMPSPSGLAGPRQVLGINMDSVVHAGARLKLIHTGPQDNQGGLLCSSQGLKCVVSGILSTVAGWVVHRIWEHGGRGDDVRAAAGGSCGGALMGMVTLCGGSGRGMSLTTMFQHELHK